MKYELSQCFYFEAAHTLNRAIDGDSSRRIHGHTYHAEVTIRGIPDQQTGMIVDLGMFRNSLAEIKELLDHRLLDEIKDLGNPTLENLCNFMGKILIKTLPAIYRISISRKASGDSCSLIFD
ncbi:6-pyruvoyl trahydropterin synthase family protein [Herbaspirillum rhizosphaerae]|uniref:6-pyruvoyl trahydropterin synthase family protein n=1 Tax=Herbaspirillum rhizosphaerae TaxID=346179 RepID=UPI0009F8D9A1|nr:6-carboxytetrahydropterin synthase [Herbaspirillum rhizosphaerae]